MDQSRHRPSNLLMGAALPTAPDPSIAGMSLIIISINIKSLHQNAETFIKTILSAKAKQLNFRLHFKNSNTVILLVRLIIYRQISPQKTMKINCSPFS